MCEFLLSISAAGVRRGNEVNQVRRKERSGDVSGAGGHLGGDGRDGRPGREAALGRADEGRDGGEAQ